MKRITVATLAIVFSSMLAAQSSQRLEHVPDARGFDVGEVDHFDLGRRRHDVGDAELVAPQAPPGRNLHRPLAEKVGGGDQAEDDVALVDHEEQPHAARDHELVRARERRLLPDGGRAHAREIGHHLQRRRIRRHARGRRLRRPAKPRARAELSDRQRVEYALHRYAESNLRA